MAELETLLTKLESGNGKGVKTPSELVLHKLNYTAVAANRVKCREERIAHVFGGNDLLPFELLASSDMFSGKLYKFEHFVVGSTHQGQRVLDKKF